MNGLPALRWAGLAWRPPISRQTHDLIAQVLLGEVASVGTVSGSEGGRESGGSDATDRLAIQLRRDPGFLIFAALFDGVSGSRTIDELAVTVGDRLVSGLGLFGSEPLFTGADSALSAGWAAAAEKLWLRYVEKVARLARRHFVGRRGRVANEDDVVAEVFTDFLEGVRDGRFPKLKDRHDLWQLLVMLTERKAVDQLRRQSATKRGGGLVAGESAFAKAGANGSEFAGIGQVVGGEPSPEFAAELADLFAHLLRALGDETLRTIARDTISGHTQEEIAQTVGLSVPSIQRKLRIIRDTWERELK